MLIQMARWHPIEQECIELSYTPGHAYDCLDETSSIHNGHRDIMGDMLIEPIQHGVLEYDNASKCKWNIGDLSLTGDDFGQ